MFFYSCHVGLQFHIYDPSDGIMNMWPILASSYLVGGSYMTASEGVTLHVNRVHGEATKHGQTHSCQQAQVIQIQGPTKRTQ